MQHTVETLERTLNEIHLLHSQIISVKNKTADFISESIDELTNLHSTTVPLLEAAEYLYAEFSKEKSTRGYKSKSLKVYAERLNNTIGKSIESYRSMLSYEKADILKQTR